MLIFFTKLVRFRLSLKNGQGQSEISFCFTNKFCGQVRDPLFKYRYDMEHKKWFLLTRLFSLLTFLNKKTGLS